MTEKKHLHANWSDPWRVPPSHPRTDGGHPQAARQVDVLTKPEPSAAKTPPKREPKTVEFYVMLVLVALALATAVFTLYEGELEAAGAAFMVSGVIASFAYLRSRTKKPR